jgi:glycosyltransferase involved in cell wall biosynthesis
MTHRDQEATKRPSVFFAAAISPNKIGGVETFSIELARQLNRRGWDLTICFLDHPPPLVEKSLLASGNVSLAVMRDQLGMGLSNVKESLKLFRKHRPKVLLYTLGGVVRWWPLLGRLVGVRRSFYYDQTSRKAKNYGYHASKRVQLLMKLLSGSVCATQFVKGCSDREGIIPSGKSIVIYSAVDTGRNLGDGEVFKKRYEIPRGRIVVLQISWLVPEKGIDLALRAAKRALEVRKDLQFVFCGDGANREEYEQLAEKLEIAGNVTWTGQIEDLPGSGAFRAADIQIQCSQWHEAFCLAVAEGMCASLPVVASRIGGLPELVEDGINGFLFDPKSEIELADAILKAAADEKLRARMGAIGRERAIESHDLVRNVGLWLDILLRSGKGLR